VHDKKDELTGGEIREIFSRYKSDFIFIEGEFGNPGSARNSGLTKVDCDWVCFWDSDDLPDVDAFLEMVDFADSVNASAVAGDFQIQNIITNQVFSKSFPESVDSLIDSCLASPGLWRFAFRVNVMNKVRFPELSMGEDAIYLYRTLKENTPILLFNRVVYTYFQGIQGQLTQNSSVRNELCQAIRILRGGKENDSFEALRIGLIIKFCGSLLKRSNPLNRLKALTNLIYVTSRSPHLTLKSLRILIM